MIEDVIFLIILACLVLFAYMAPLLSRGIRKDKKYYITIVLVVSILHLLSFMNAHFVTLKGAGNDAYTFHLRAIEWAASGEWHFVLSHHLYTQLLGALYSLTGPSLFLAQEFSVCAFVLTAVFLRKFISLFSSDRYSVGILVLFSFLPKILIVHSVTLREPFEILFLVMASYYGILVTLNSKFRNMLFFLVCCIGVAITHKALMLYSVILLFIFIFFSSRESSLYKVNTNKIFVVLFFAVVAFATFTFLPQLSSIPGLGTVNIVLNTDVDEANRILSSKANLEARTTYNHQIDFSNPVSFIISLFVSLIYYLFKPFPWEINTFDDVYGGLEALLRGVLILGSFAALKSSQNNQYKLTIVMLVIYFTLAILWASGTSNVGTAFRHNVTHTWIIILLGYPILHKFIHRLKF